ncbi:MAG: T9SS type A sorting domain-containing protein [Ferruginibacter sp.]
MRQQAVINLKHFVTFTLLKKLINISILLFGITFTTFAQNKTGNPEDFTAKPIRLFPNPATSMINFELPRYDKTYTLQIFNFMGKKVSELVPSSSLVNLPLDGYFRGVYIFQLRDKNGKIMESGRFQVVK